MTWVTSMPCAALLASPITLLADAVVSFNVLSLLAPALSAWAGFLLAQYITRDTSSSLIAGYLFGFSSYELGEMLGHLHLNMTFVVPLLVLLVVQRIRGIFHGGALSSRLRLACFFNWASRPKFWRQSASLVLSPGSFFLPLPLRRNVAGCGWLVGRSSWQW